MNDERMKISVGELKEFVRNKVASLRTVEQIKELWPEAYDIVAEAVQGLVFMSRFQKPEWYKEEQP